MPCVMPWRGGSTVMSFRRLLALNAAVLMAAMACGWAVSERPSRDIFDAGSRVSSDVRIWSTAAYVLSRNLLVVGLLVAGASTLGALTLATLAVNGYRLGFGFGTVYLASRERALWLLAYLPFEFGGLLLASTAAMMLSCQLCLSLLFGHEVRAGGAWKALAVAVGMLVIAAVIEGVAARTIAGF